MGGRGEEEEGGRERKNGGGRKCGCGRKVGIDIQALRRKGCSVARYLCKEVISHDAQTSMLDKSADKGYGNSNLLGGKVT